ncbi:MAG TPA: radical SAM/SPASM domain-containing protein [Thermoanaerobaculia bacterium]|nr:radical SAM/SPASM domain-containing protein [Thermoanaerobaculia bacterium]
MPTLVATHRINPYLHIDTDRVYNPLTDRALVAGDDAYARFRAFERDGEVDDALLRDGWIVAAEADLSAAYRLKIVSLETMTTCNQKCYFCPVSIAPREDEMMPDALFHRIVNELTAFRGTLESVFLQSYNEPTLDRRFVDQCRTLFEAGLPVAVLSNGSGLTAAKVDALIESGPLRYLCINLSTLDRERYKAERGEDHLGVVLRNLDYLKDRPVAQEMRMVVLGKGDDTHQRDFEAIRDRFAGTRFTVDPQVVMDRAGWLDVGMKPASKQKQLAGCDNVGSRPIQHLHITPRGRCVLCCEDYDENYVVGDLTKNTIAEVLEGPELAQMRRWVYGLEEAPDDFMCRDCVFARTR